MHSSIFFKSILSIFALLLLSGCGSRQIQPIAYDHQVLTPENQRIGVISTQLPETDIIYPGANCLLCIGAAAAMNSSLGSHAETLDASELYDLKQDVANAISQDGREVVILEEYLTLKELEDVDSESPTASLKDYRKFGKDRNLTHLFVIDYGYVGFQRNYAAYVPTSDPFARFTGRAFLVDTQNNEYKWYLPVSVEKMAEGEWDEPDEGFPGLTNALYQSLGAAKDLILAPILKSKNNAELSEANADESVLAKSLLQTTDTDSPATKE